MTIEVNKDFSLYFLNLKIIVKVLLLLLCSFISWNYFGIFFIVFLFFVFEELDKSRNCTIIISIYRITILLTIWQFGSIFWLFDIELGVYVFLSNILLYLIPFIVTIYIKKLQLSIFIFIPIWLLFEYIILNVNFLFPWLILGNLFSNQPYLVQWYEITGVIGGSAWILLLAFILYSIKKEQTKRRFLFFILSLALPIITSFYIESYRNRVLKIKNTISIITYNDAYKEKFIARDKLTYNILNKIDTTKNYDFLVIPEQTIRGLDGKNIIKSLAYKYLKDYIDKEIFGTILVGTTGFRNKDTLVNSTLILSKDRLYRKIKKRLILYTEYIPPLLYSFYKKKFYRSDVKDDLKLIKDNLHIQPLICYESFYPYFVSKDLNSVNLIFITSSEKFMNGNNFALNQYNKIVSLRSIENRIPLVKASNSGWSVYTNVMGDIISKQNNEINLFNIDIVENHNTFYKTIGAFITLPVLVCFLIISILFPKL